MKLFALILSLLLAGTSVFSQPSADTAAAELPLRRLAIFSSGVGFFQHAGNISSSALVPARITLPFSAAAVNDALKSLVVNDPGSDFPTVTYASATALRETLKGLKIDLSGTPEIGDILNSLKGTEVEIAGPVPISGRILGVEKRERGISLSGEETAEAWLSLYSAGAIRMIALKDISSFSFKDDAVNTDLKRALDLIMAAQGKNTRDLLLSLPGVGSRDVSLSYVIPVPVWKVTYRLDLGAAASASFFQGWAIVDNDSDTDWNGVELSLVTGRPVSFIQNLYAPYRTARPVVPLAIAGIAESHSYESGSSWESYDEDEYEASSSILSAPQPMAEMSKMDRSSAAPLPSNYRTAAGNALGDQFEFTLKNPIHLERRRSAMLPLVEGSINAEKILVFPGARAVPGVSLNPAISAELTNTSGMKLPAGPITVYDGGTYAGDALIEFFPENEKRLISYGDDLSVSGSADFTSSRFFSAVTVRGGVMTISRRQSYERVYTIRNASGEAKKIIIEHPVTQGTTLAEPAAFDERTPSLYRFKSLLPAKGELKFTVREDQPLSERIVLAQLRKETFVSYTTNQEIPAAVRNALQKAVELKQKADEEAAAKQELENQLARLVSEQNRIRQNLEAVGNQTPQGQTYLQRMAALDDGIDTWNDKITEAGAKVQAAQKDYENYLANLEISG
ncbi:hypothetical protein AGMMS49928_24620 [Spirochaetia bacterium]|nr:hypothetical protein AGMMS49928_24620 [Spirochaetia bacterium]